MDVAADKRRSRTKRTPTGRRIVIVERDLQILIELYRYRYLSSAALTALINPRSPKRFIERLGNLYHELGLVDRPTDQWDAGKALYRPVVYTLSRAGFDLLEAESDLSFRLIPSKRSAPSEPVPQFEHAIAVTQALACTEVNARLRGERIVPFEEITDRGNFPFIQPAFSVRIVRPQEPPFETMVRPDAVYGIEYPSKSGPTYRFFALELERKSPLRRRSLKQSSTRKKILAYKAAINSGSYRTALGIPNLFPRFVGQNDEHTKSIEALAAELLTEEDRQIFRFG